MGREMLIVGMISERRLIAYCIVWLFEIWSWGFWSSIVLCCIIEWSDLNTIWHSVLSHTRALRHTAAKTTEHNILRFLHNDWEEYYHTEWGWCWLGREVPNYKTEWHHIPKRAIFIICLILFPQSNCMKLHTSF